MKKDDNIIEVFTDGIRRVLKIVNSNQNYDAIIGEKRLSLGLYHEIYSDLKSKKNKLAADKLSKYFEGNGIKFYKVPGSARVLFCGNTKNNIRELENLITSFKNLPCIDVVKISDCDVENIRVDKDTSILVRKCVEKALGEVECKSLSGVRQLILYVSFFFSYLETFKTKRVFLTRGIVSNDHSPNPVAFSMICKLFGMKRLYLQHAEVTENFPPLDFEYTILHNQKSKLIYEKIGKTKCETYVRRNLKGLSVSSVLDRHQRILESSIATVVVYPSSQFDREILNKLLMVLKANKSCDVTKVKFHPQYKMEAKYKDLATHHVLETPHVAIVGNSSVALELALSGNLVILIDCLDSISFDYYGFLKEGLIQSVDFSDISKESFWMLNDCFQEYIIAIKNRLDVNDEDDIHILKKIYVDFLSLSAHSSTYENRLLSELTLYPSTSFRHSRKVRCYKDEALKKIKGYEKLFSDRLIPLNNLYQNVTYEACASPDDFWILTKKIEWAGYQATNDELDFLLHYALKIYEPKDRYSNWLVAKLFAVFLRLKSVRHLVDLKNLLPSFDLYKYGANQKIGFLNFVHSLDDVATKERLFKIYNNTDDYKLSRLDALKLRVLVKDLDLNNKNKINSNCVEAEYLESIQGCLRDEYKHYVLKFKNTYQDQCEFIDTKFNEKKRSELILLIQDRLVNEVPFSLLRLSDGEGYIFPHFESDGLFSLSDCLNRERHWWGQEIPEQLRSKIQRETLEAINSCDIIGVPTIYRFLRDTSHKTITFKNSLQGRGLLSVLSGILQLEFQTKLFVDDKFNLEFVTDQFFVDKIIPSAKKVVVISGARQESFNGFFDCYNAEYITIPTHNKQAASSKFYSDENPLPYHLGDIKSEIIRSVMPGTLVLIGAGVAGKAFALTAKESGGCAIDMGSAMDILSNAGIHSLH